MQHVIKINLFTWFIHLIDILINIIFKTSIKWPLIAWFWGLCSTLKKYNWLDFGLEGVLAKKNGIQLKALVQNMGFSWKSEVYEVASLGSDLLDDIHVFVLESKSSSRRMKKNCEYLMIGKELLNLSVGNKKEV